MAADTWSQLLEGFPWFVGKGKYPLPAYSEFMPPPRVGRKPYQYCDRDTLLFDRAHPHHLGVNEYEEAFELRPGLEQVAAQLIPQIANLDKGGSSHTISKQRLVDNPAWPASLADKPGRFEHERYVTLASLALSRTQDDKGRVRWTCSAAARRRRARFGKVSDSTIRQPTR